MVLLQSFWKQKASVSIKCNCMEKIGKNRFSEFLLLISTKEKVEQVWNNMRASEWQNSSHPFDASVLVDDYYFFKLILQLVWCIPSLFKSRTWQKHVAFAPKNRCVLLTAKCIHEYVCEYVLRNLKYLKLYNNGLIILRVLKFGNEKQELQNN